MELQFSFLLEDIEPSKQWVSEPRNPLKLKERLEMKTGSSLNLDHHIFRGMKNPNTFCYVISLLQLFFHCDDFVKYVKEQKPENDTEELLKIIHTYLYSSNSNSADISDFLFGWNGWGMENAGFPNGFQDVQEFFLYFYNTLSNKLKKLFEFKCILNEVHENTTPTKYPNNLFIQLDRAKGTQILSNNYIAVNKTIVFGSEFYSFKGAIVYIESHYRAIIKIEDEYFDFDDNNVSPLFLDTFSVFPSSYNRCMECEKLLHRNSVLFLYEHTDHDDVSEIHLSPNMRKMMGSNKTGQTILQFHQSGDNAKYVEVPNNELFREVVNLKEFPGVDLKGTMKINTKGIPDKEFELLNCFIASLKTIYFYVELCIVETEKTFW